MVSCSPPALFREISSGKDQIPLQCWKLRCWKLYGNGECGKSGKTLIGVFKEIKYDLRVCGHNMLETTFEVRLSHKCAKNGKMTDRDDNDSVSLWHLLKIHDKSRTSCRNIDERDMTVRETHLQILQYLFYKLLKTPWFSRYQGIYFPFH